MLTMAILEHPMKLSVKYILGISVAVLAGLIIYPIIYNLSHSNSNYSNPGMSALKYLATSIVIYRADYDGLFPATSAMPSTRAVLFPYAKIKDSFDRMPGHHSIPEFNFNLAGVSETLPPYPVTDQVESSQVGVFYCLDIDKPGYFMIHIDGSVKSYSLNHNEEVQQMLGHQFDRKGVKLQPADYLENEDPLK